MAELPIRVVVLVCYLAAFIRAGEISITVKTKNYAGGYCAPVSGIPAACRPLHQCSVWYKELPPGSTCGAKGTWKACCPGVKGGKLYANLLQEQSLESELLHLPKNEVDYVSVYGANELSRVAAIEATLLEHKVYLKKEGPSYGHYMNQKPSDKALISAEKGLMVTRATQMLKKRLKLSNDAAGIATQQISVKGTALEFTCIDEPKCYPSKFRTHDGACNNLAEPNMGRAHTQLDRILPPDYDDGIWEGRDKYMPNSRVARVVLADNLDEVSHQSTMLLMQWGQFIDHDMTHVPVFRMANGSGIECCTQYGDYVPPNLKHPHCFVVDILPNDPFYSRYGVKCLNFVRSMVAQRADCAFGYAEQLNQVSHWLDGSAMYGSSKAESRLLRAFKGGRLRSSMHGGYEMLPTDVDSGPCVGSGKGYRCFKAGDSRVNQVFSLTAVQILFLREHNRIVGVLAQLNPHWGDDRLYHEGRRIIGAVLQHITYNEYLPLVLDSATPSLNEISRFMISKPLQLLVLEFGCLALYSQPNVLRLKETTGRDVLEAYGLVPKTRGCTSYNSTISGGVLNEFSTAAYRYGHSTINHWFDLVDDYGKPYQRMQLRYYYNNPHILLRPDVYDGILRGLVTTEPQSADEHFSNDVTDYLFKREDSEWGFDLIAFNVWRGRDHGLPGYNKYRELMGLRKAYSWYDLGDVFTKKTIDKMRKLYRTPDEIDLYIAGMSEVRRPGSLLGPTFVKIIADQFARLKFGDRFFYEHGGEVNSFKPDQLNAIRRTSMASIICSSSKSIKHVQPLVFRMPSDLFVSFPDVDPEDGQPHEELCKEGPKYLS